MTTLALLSTALLFGGMVLYSFGFAAFLFTACTRFKNPVAIGVASHDPRQTNWLGYEEDPR